MVLTGMGYEDCSLADLRAIYPLESLWTIDLAYILRHFNIADFTMYTSYIGVNWRNATKHFYKDSLSEDVQRIRSLFANARESAVRVVPLILSMDDICRFLISNRYAIIVLVNATMIKCRTCRRIEMASRCWWPFRPFIGLCDGRDEYDDDDS
eukprot:jgi/Hompol1/1338/HPOL_005566-RA